MKFLFTFVFSTIILLSTFAQDLPIIPKPEKIIALSGKPFPLGKKISIYYLNEELKNEAIFLQSLCEGRFKSATETVAPTLLAKKSTEFSFPDQTVLLLINPKLANEEYHLEIREKLITITGGNTTGVFYGIQSLNQLISHADNNILNSIVIKDRPRFEWRGMHLDVCRHFFDVEFIKKYIDLIALHKMNVFHWHLTEDQGWRIEIKKYPKLTSVGGWRNGSMIGHYSQHMFDTIRYGGFYTQEEIKEIVKYAAERHVTIVPEIEMPGHSLAALAAYPNLSCTGGPFEVAKQWGVFDDVYCAGNEETFGFLQDVLDEVCELFPGKYIHIGGDECPKTRWEKCEKCQDRMAQQHLKDEHELQSYFIQRIEKYLNRKGKQIIGWDEILEGGLAPNAAVMSWRGTEGGIAAAKEKHKVVMTPGSHCYFDHYQGEPRHEPIAIGGFTTVEKVYSYDPVPTELSPEEAKYIMGAQGNVWTEYIYTSSHVEYMALPRMCALAEVLWTKKELKNEADFLERLVNHSKLLVDDHINLSRVFLSPEVGLVPDTEKLTVKVHSKFKSGTIHTRIQPFSSPIKVDELTFEPTKNDAQFTIEQASQFYFYFCYDSIICSNISIKEFEPHLATNKPLFFTVPPDKKYSHNHNQLLVDGVQGDFRRNVKEWNAWQGSDIEVTIDLKKATKIKTIKIGYLSDQDNWIYPVRKISLSSSKKGKKFKSIKSDENLPDFTYVTKYKDEIKLDKSIKTRFIKIKIPNPGKIPDGKPGAGKDSWIFLDEIEIY